MFGQHVDRLLQRPVTVSGFGRLVAQRGVSHQPVHIGHAPEKVRGQTQVLEGGSNFLHFADPPARFGRHSWQSPLHPLGLTPHLFRGVTDMYRLLGTFAGAT